MYKLSRLAIIGLAATALFGCTRQPTPMDEARAEFVCREHGGAYSFYNAFSQITIVCRDGKQSIFVGDKWVDINDPFIAERLQEK